MTLSSDALHSLHLQARTLLDNLHPLAKQAPGDLQPAWAEHLDRLEDLAQFLDAGGQVPPSSQPHPAVSQKQWVEFGRLLRDRRNAAGLSRVLLARRAKLSDATIKFTETARHPPSRATLIRLIARTELQLRWTDVPGHAAQPIPAPLDYSAPRTEPTPSHGPLNCLLVPGTDPLIMISDLAQFLNGAGGYLEQTNAYLEHGSAADYRTLCQSSISLTRLRSSLPLSEVAQQIRIANGRAPLQVLALGAGDGRSEAQLVACLLEAGTAPLELCLLDISLPLLHAAYHHTSSRLAAQSQVYIWALQGNFHHLSLYAALRRPACGRPRRLVTMLGGTLANLDHEPRFLQQSLLDCEPGDLLLLDLPLAPAPCTEPAAIRRRDPLFADGVPPSYESWLSGPLRRHCAHVERIRFHWDLETHCPIPGSYALHAVATVQCSQHPDRRFSLFRFARYEPRKLAECLSDLGWEEIAAVPYGGTHSLRLYRKSGPGKHDVAESVTAQAEGAA